MRAQPRPSGRLCAKGRVANLAAYPGQRRTKWTRSNQRCKRPPRRGKFTKTGKHEENGRFPSGARGPEQALANGGQKAPGPPEALLCPGKFPRPETDIGGHTRTQPCCSGRLCAKGRVANLAAYPGQRRTKWSRGTAAESASDDGYQIKLRGWVGSCHRLMCWRADWSI